MRGYDRPTIEGRLIPRSRYNSNRYRLAVTLAFFGLLALIGFFGLGYRAAKRDGSEIQGRVRGTEATNEQSEGAQQPEIVVPVKKQQVERKRVAVAVTVTKDGPYLDGAAVLQHSIRMTKSKYAIDMVAIVHAGVQTTRPALEALGFRIIEFPPPVDSKNIKGKHLR